MASHLEDVQLPSGNWVTVSIPDHVDENTQVIHVTGLRGISQPNYSADPLVQEVQNGACSHDEDVILIFPHDVDSNFIRDSSDSVTTLEDMFNVQFNNVGYEGFSAGSHHATLALSNYLVNNPDASRQSLILIDGDLDDSGQLSESVLQPIRDNNSIIISCSQPNYWEHQANQLKMPILYVVDDECPSPEEYKANYMNIYPKYHVPHFKKFFTDGLYQDISSFINGTGELPSEGYSYRFYDPETNEIREIDASEAAKLLNLSYSAEGSKGTFGKFSLTFDKLSNLSDCTVKSDNKVLADGISNIRSTISNTSFVKNGGSCAGFSSTTLVPSHIPDVFKEYLTSTASLLEKIAQETEKLDFIGVSIEETDNKIRDESEDINGKDDPVVQLSDEGEDPPRKENPPKKENPPRKEDTPRKENPPKKEDPPKKGNYYPSGGGGGGGTPEPSNGVDPSSSTDLEDFFNSDIENNPLYNLWNFNELKSNDNMLVYDFGKNCKVIIHKNGNKIIGFEHFYSMNNENDSNAIFNYLNANSANKNSKIIRNGNGIKVVFSPKIYENVSIDDVIKKFSL